MASPSLSTIAAALEAARLPTGGYEGFQYHKASAALLSALKLHPDIPPGERSKVIHRGITLAAASGPFTESTLAAGARAAESEYLRKRIQRFQVATSIHPRLPPSVVTRYISGVSLVLSQSWPAYIITSRRDPGSRITSEDQLPHDSTLVLAEVLARTPAEAFHHCNRAISLLRGLWNFALTFRSIRLMSGGPSPLGKLRIGRVHTVHVPGDSAPVPTHWYEGVYSRPPRTTLSSRDWRLMTRNEAVIRRSLRSIPYSSDLWAGLARYAEALESADFGSVFLRMWALLEFLTATEHLRNDVTVQRAGFVFGREPLAMALLAHLQNQRNQHVHQDAADIALEDFASQTKDFVDGLFSVHFGRGHRHASRDEFGRFLSLPSDPAALASQIELRQDAIRFLS